MRTIHPIKRTAITKLESLPRSDPPRRTEGAFVVAVEFLGPRHDGPRPAFAPKPKLNCEIKKLYTIMEE